MYTHIVLHNITGWLVLLNRVLIYDTSNNLLFPSVKTIYKFLMVYIQYYMEM